MHRLMGCVMGRIEERRDGYVSKISFQYLYLDRGHLQVTSI